MPPLSHLSHLSPTFPQVWIEPVEKPVCNSAFSGECSPIPVPQLVEIVPYPHPWTACGQLFGSSERRTSNWGQRGIRMWTHERPADVMHRRLRFLPRSSPSPVDDPTPAHRAKRWSSPVSTGPTTTTTSLTMGGINNHRVMQQSSPRLTALEPKGEAP